MTKKLAKSKYRDKALSSSGRPIKSTVPNLPCVDRELSWLAFNERVLQQALDPSIPLLERVRFLRIFHSNLNEFYMKRLDPIRHLAMSGAAHHHSFGTLSAIDLLGKIRETVVAQFQLADRCFTENIYPSICDHGLEIVNWNHLTSNEKDFCENYFSQKIFPTLTPLAVDPGHPFPFISNLSLSLAVSLRHPQQDDLLFARIKIPPSISSLIELPSPKWKARWVPLIEVIKNCLHKLFPNMQIVSTLPFRVIRNIEMERREEDADSLLEMITQELRDRRFEDVVRLEINNNPDPWLLHFLMDELGLTELDVYQISEFAMMDFTPLLNADLPHLKFVPWTPVTPARFSEDPDIFFAISQDDVFLHHPYENFTTTVERFIHQAADDPKVLAIKMTLYRTQEDSSFVKSLIRAAENGKQVVCIVELKARLDEENNIRWANKLESSGVHVVYGIVGLKTHCKLALVVRQESEGLRCYAHIGTGNYHGQTAKAYTDVGIMTANQEITHEVVEVFNYLSGRSLKTDYKHLLVAPITLRNRILELIDLEIENHKKGLPAEIFLKLNNLEDTAICSQLVKASQAGIPVRLLVRSVCTLLPHVSGLSDNIEIKAIVDRFLEHSRIFYFRSGSEDPTHGLIYLSSADLMQRNLSGRVEVAMPILSDPHKVRCYHILETMWQAKRSCWRMAADGTYHKMWDGQTVELSGQQQLIRELRPNFEDTKVL